MASVEEQSEEGCGETSSGGKEVMDTIRNLANGELAFLTSSNPIPGSFTLSTKTCHPILEMKHNDAL